MKPEIYKGHTCCFIGHRKIAETPELKNNLSKSIERLITENGVDTFLFGSKSDFDDLCRAVVTELKEKHPHIRRIYVRAEYEHISEDYRNYLLRRCDDTYYPENISGSGKAAYVERNHEMINNSEYCIVYYDENYAPPTRKNSKRDLLAYQPKSGTKVAYDYAVKKGKTIINLLS